MEHRIIQPKHPCLLKNLRKDLMGTSSSMSASLPLRLKSAFAGQLIPCLIALPDSQKNAGGRISFATGANVLIAKATNGDGVGSILFRRELEVRHCQVLARVSGGADMR